MYAHASGFNWDEALMVIAPISIACALTICARRRQASTHADTPERDRA